MDRNHLPLPAGRVAKGFFFVQGFVFKVLGREKKETTTGNGEFWVTRVLPSGNARWLVGKNIFFDSIPQQNLVKFVEGPCFVT